LSCILCTQCCQCIWVVHSWLSLWFSITFVLWLVYPMLPVFLGFIKNGQPRDTGNIGFTKHRTKGRVNQRDNQDRKPRDTGNIGWLFLWFSLSFVLCLMYSMLPVSLGCPFLIVPLVFSTLCPVSYVPNVASVSGLSILDCLFGFL
jgi:hypothetical protein